jgi:V8-like Glu-specific endopeptidase
MPLFCPFRIGFKSAIEDQIRDQQSLPLRFAYPVPVNYTLENSGVWQDLDDGSRVWRLTVNLPNALSVHALYDKLWLPESSKFFVYNAETQQYIGAITSEFIGGNKENPIEFATGIIYGENITFEYYQPAFVVDSAIISISRIDYGYRYIHNSNENILFSFGDAGNCHVNINCSEGNNWQMEKHAAARVMIVSPNDSGWCSCAMVNNTNNDFTPYVLTANHCLEGLDAINNNNASQWIFYWEYEHPGCNNSTTQPTLRTTIGATVIANNSTSDFALLELTQDPRNATGVTPYYLGWDRTGNAGTSAVGIHHPAGDVKKIATLNNATTSSGSFWQHYWNQTVNGHSVTEGGSSGSPLLNNAHHVIGQLYGGSSLNCSNPSQDLAMYGKFNVSWTGNGASDNRRKLQPWLDPANAGVSTLNGIGFSSISGTATICTTPATYTLSSGTASSWSVTPTSAFSLISTYTASAVVKPLHLSGQAGTLTATVHS